MKITSWVIVILLCFAGLLVAKAKAATYMGFDYPYHILKDGNKIRYCMGTEIGATTIICWTNGNKQICDLRTPEDGFIDCPIKDE